MILYQTRNATNVYLSLTVFKLISNGFHRGKICFVRLVLCRQQPKTNFACLFVHNLFPIAVLFINRSPIFMYCSSYNDPFHYIQPALILKYVCSLVPNLLKMLINKLSSLLKYTLRGFYVGTEIKGTFFFLPCLHNITSKERIK
jgi:hypothetical protein